MLRGAFFIRPKLLERGTVFLASQMVDSVSPDVQVSALGLGGHRSECLLLLSKSRRIGAHGFYVCSLECQIDGMRASRGGPMFHAF
jgi:hypothetical protein